MARFLSGLNGAIRDKVELLPYVSMEELLHKSLQVEQQAKRRGNERRYSSPNSNHKGNGDNHPSHNPNSSKHQPRSSKSPPKIHHNSKNDSTSTSTKTRNISCFKCNGRGHYAYDCPSKRMILIKDNGEYTSESETESLYEVGDSEKEPIVLECKEGAFLMVRRMLGSQIMPLDNSQRDNIFHARCNVKGRLCSLIIDGGSCTNVASTTLVSKLKLETKPHPKPYKLQWLSDDGETMVQEQVEVGITIGQYVDTVLCDVVPMEASHVLLGRPWQYDMRAIHDGFSNCISFSQKGKKFILKPLTPKEVSEDTKRMRETRLGEWSDKRKSKDGNKETNKMSAEGEKSNTKLSVETKEGETQTKTICFSRKCEVRNSLLIRKSFLENSNCFDENQDFEKDSLSTEIALQANMTFQDLEDKHSKEAPMVVICAKDTSPKETMELNTNELNLGKEIHNSDLSLIDYPSLFVDNKSLDLRTNLLQEGGYDEDIKGAQLLQDLDSSKIKETNEDSNPKEANSSSSALMKDQSLILKDQPLIISTKVISNYVIKIGGFYKIYSGGGGTLHFKGTTPQLEDTILHFKGLITWTVGMEPK